MKKIIQENVRVIAIAAACVVICIVGIIIGVQHKSQVSAIDETPQNEAVAGASAESTAAGTQKNKEDETTTEETKVHKEPPVIYGVEDKTFELGEKISYMSGVYAVDDLEAEIDVEVNKSEVNADEAGEYTVIYTAKDSEGNETTETAVFAIVEPKPAPATYNSLDDIVAQVLSEVIDNSMSVQQKVNAIYNYAHGRIGYSTYNFDGSDWTNEAYKALVAIENSGYVGGDCFTCASVAYALLQGMGAQVIWVDNQGATTGDHSWVLCNVGTGWYHFDATRMYDKFICNMLTDVEMQAYIDAGHSIYRRDYSAYPSTPDASFY